MTIGATKLTSGTSATDATSYVTASISPAADSLLLVFVASEIGTTPPPTCTPTGLSLTFVERANVSVWTTRRVQCFTAQCGATPGSGTLTLTMTDAGSGATSIGCGWAVIEVTGHHTTTPVVQAPTNGDDAGSTNGTVTLATSGGADNRAFAWFGHGTAEATGPNTGWTELSDDNHVTPGMGYESQWRSTDFTTGDAAATFPTGSKYNAIAIEIAAAGAATLSLPPPRHSLWLPNKTGFRLRRSS